MVVLAAILGLYVWKAGGPVEPAYEGKTLSQWLDGHVPSADYGSPGWLKADEALRQIGTNAIPTLLRMIRATDSEVKIELSRLAEKQRWIRYRYKYARPRNEEAAYAFEKLGTNAASAVPELIKIYEKNFSASSQKCAAQALGSIGRPARAAIPALLRNFTHTNEFVRTYAVSAVVSIGGEPDTVIPALRGALKDSRKGTRWNAANGLHNYGRRASAAVPDLLEALKDASIQEPVEKALWNIAPETIAKVTVVEDASPMIVNGVTTEALGRKVGTELWTIIPAGETIPCARYGGWGSDRDSQLRIVLELYRGTHRRSTNNYFLGRFEVMGIAPPPAEIHVQIAYLILNQQILLCAYEDRQRKFLEIRRMEVEIEK